MQWNSGRLKRIEVGHHRQRKASFCVEQDLWPAHLYAPTYTHLCPFPVPPLSHTHPYHALWHATVSNPPYKSHSESRKLRLSRAFAVPFSSELRSNKQMQPECLPPPCHPPTCSPGPPSLIKRLSLTAFNDRHLSPLRLGGVHVCARVEGARAEELTSTVQH